MKKRLLPVMTGAALTVLLAACSNGVSQEEYQALQKELDTLKTQLEETEPETSYSSTTVPSQAITTAPETSPDGAASPDNGKLSDQLTIQAYIDRAASEAVVLATNTSDQFLSGYLVLTLYPDCGQQVDMVLFLDNLPAGEHTEGRKPADPNASTTDYSWNFVGAKRSEQPVDNTGTLDESVSAVATAEVAGLSFDGIIGTKAFRTETTGYVVVTVTPEADAFSISHNVLSRCSALKNIPYPITLALVVTEDGTILSVAAARNA